MTTVFIKHAMCRTIKKMAPLSFFIHAFWFIPVFKDGEQFHGVFKILSAEVVEITYYTTMPFGHIYLLHIRRPT